MHGSTDCEFVTTQLRKTYEINESLAMCKSHIEASVYLNKRVIYSNNDTNIRLTIDIK